MLTAQYLRQKFDAALPYDRYVATGTPPQQQSWGRIYNQCRLTPAQTALVQSFTRRMPVLVSSGTWCGDCVQQCPLMQRIAEASSPPPLGRGPGGGTPAGTNNSPPSIDLRFLDRDEHKDLTDQIQICAGSRVPTVIFMAEDFEFCGIAGDKSLARFRALASRQLGASCPLPGAPVDDDELAATLQDWLNDFERIHLMLRLSGRLRQKHGD